MDGFHYLLRFTLIWLLGFVSEKQLQLCIMVDATLHGLFHEACVNFAENICITCIFEKHQLSVSYNEMKCIVKEFCNQWKLVDISTDDFVGIIAEELDVGVIAVLIG